MRAIQTLTFDRGAYGEGGTVYDTNAVMLLKRPFLKLVGHPERNPDYMEGYDGAAWEWTRDPGYTIRTTGAASEAIRHYADIDGPFVDYKEKGSTVALVGTARVGDRTTYRLRLTMMDGYATDFFIDTATFLMLASRHSAKVHAYGAKVTSETRYEDYRAVAGVQLPFRTREVSLIDGKELNTMQWRVITPNADLPDAWFSPPAYTRTPLQAFMEHLYMQRIDPVAAMWTYRAFRRVYPAIDSREATETIAFEILKDGQTRTAIALFERNAADYPHSASAAFELGRAYRTAERNADARREFRRALRIDPKHERASKALKELGVAPTR